MRFLTRLMLLAIAFAVCALPDYGQEVKTKEDAPLPTAAGPPTPAIEYTPSMWKEYSSQRGQFSVMFPGTLVEDVDNSSGVLTGRKYTLTTTAAYVVSYMDLPADFPLNPETDATLRKQLFDKMRDEPLLSLKGKILTETEVTLDSHPGRMLKVALPDATVMRQKCYVAGKRIYTLLVMTPNELQAADGGRFDESRATRFLDSFKIGRPVAIEENPAAWKEYSSTSGRFTVLFPGTPVVTDNSYDTPFGRRDAHSYQLIGSIEYMASYTDYVIELEKDPPEFNKTLDYIRDHSAEDIKSKVLDETAITIAGHKGRMTRLASPDGSITTVKAFAVAKRLYLVIVSTPAISQTADGGRANEAWATKFFDSIKVTSQ